MLEHGRGQTNAIHRAKFYNGQLHGVNCHIFLSELTLNGLDELSLILLIENEVMSHRRHHHVQTAEEALAFWRELYSKPLLKQWLERSRSGQTKKQRLQSSIVATPNMMSEAVCYDVMLSKMLRTVVPKSKLLQVVSKRDEYGLTLLHRAAGSGNPDSMKVILDLYPASQHLQTISTRESEKKRTVLHIASETGNSEMVKLILSLLPESQRLPVVSLKDQFDSTALHCAAMSKNKESAVIILKLLPESQRLQAMSAQDICGRTMLHCCANLESVLAVLDLLPELERSQIVCMRTMTGDTILHDAVSTLREDFDFVRAVLDSLPESQRLKTLKMHLSSDETTRSLREFLRAYASNLKL